MLVGGVALGFMAIRDLLLPMRVGFSGEANTNGATLSSGGHIGIGGKASGLGSIVGFTIQWLFNSSAANTEHNSLQYVQLFTFLRY